MTKLLGKALAGATIGAGLLAMSTIGASAAIACRGNVCWHSHETYAYPPDAGVVVHEDNWRWGPRERLCSVSTRAAAIGAAIAGRLGNSDTGFFDG